MDTSDCVGETGHSAGFDPVLRNHRVRTRQGASGTGKKQALRGNSDCGKSLRQSRYH